MFLLENVNIKLPPPPHPYRKLPPRDSADVEGDG